MILSNTEILKALDDGRIAIAPQPTPRFPTGAGNTKCPYQTTAVDLRLGPEIAWFKDAPSFAIDLREGKFSELFAPNSKRATITEEQPFTLEPGNAVLGQTLETVSLVIQKGRACLAARIEGKSSYARTGLIVHCTAPTIHAGFHGPITLELTNLGRVPILLYPGMYVCQLIVEEVVGHPFDNESQFQGQVGPGGDK